MANRSIEPHTIIEVGNMYVRRILSTFLILPLLAVVGCSDSNPLAAGGSGENEIQLKLNGGITGEYRISGVAAGDGNGIMWASDHGVAEEIHIVIGTRGTLHVSLAVFAPGPLVASSYLVDERCFMLDGQSCAEMSIDLDRYNYESDDQWIATEGDVRITSVSDDELAGIFSVQLLRDGAEGGIGATANGSFTVSGSAKMSSP